jgi:hypothetical protein
MDIRTHRAKINVLFSVVFLSAIIIFAREQVALSKINDWWLDELDALVVTDPTLDFADAFKIVSRSIPLRPFTIRHSIGRGR